MLPLYDLDEVKELAKHRSKVKISGRATQEYMRRVGCIGPTAHGKAQRGILQGIRRLTSKNFSHKWPPPGSPQPPEQFDVYGLVQYQGWDWYVKLQIVREKSSKELHVISFHPPEEALRSPDGVIICGREI